MPAGRWFAAVSLAALCAAPVLAQQQVNDGRALDNNLQVGSGGVNQPQVEPNYRARNDLVTGNVPGAGYFRGNVGYDAPETFRGGSAEDSLFRFRALSYPTSPQSAGTQGLTLLPGTAAYPQNTLNRPAVWMTGDGLIAGGAQGVPQSAWNTRSLIDPGGLLSPGSRIGTQALPDGRLLQLLPPSAEVRGPASTAVESGATQPLVESQIDPAASKLTQSVGADPLFTAPRVTWPLGIEVGQAMRNQVQAIRVDEHMPSEDQRMTQLAASLFSPLGASDAKPGDDVYLDILRGVQRNYQLAAGVSPEEVARLYGDLPTVQPVAPVADAPPPPTWLPPVTDEQLAQAEQQRQSAVARARGLPESDTGSEPIEADTDAALVRALSQQLAPLRTLAGLRESQVNALLTDAEAQLAGGRYFNAIDGFEKALTIAPGHPMAWAGLVHAQLGAGMIRSASHSMRRLFEQYPELIATRYEPRLMPSQDRIVWVRGQLDRMIETTNAPDPALMLAYVGYQFQSRDLIEYGLDLAQARQPDDPLISLLRRVWLASPTIPPRDPE
jgi:hypothetical protein